MLGKKDIFVDVLVEGGVGKNGTSERKHKRDKKQKEIGNKTGIATKKRLSGE